MDATKKGTNWKLEVEGDETEVVSTKRIALEGIMSN